VATKRELEELLWEERARSHRLEKQVERLQREVERQKLDELQVQIRDLVRKLNEALPAAKRQATPFARGKRKQHRRKPGRKAGHPDASLATPDHVDEEIFEPLTACPCCGGKVHDVVDHEQFVVDLPKIEAYVKRIVTQSGQCDRCTKRVPSSHPDQVSNAVGAARVALGPNALGLAADLKHRYGMAYQRPRLRASAPPHGHAPRSAPGLPLRTGRGTHEQPRRARAARRRGDPKTRWLQPERRSRPGSCGDRLRRPDRAPTGVHDDQLCHTLAATRRAGECGSAKLIARTTITLSTYRGTRVLDVDLDEEGLIVGLLRRGGALGVPSAGAIAPAAICDRGRHRGTDEVGGSCIELEASGER
jgi:hypothetical protein